MVDGYRYAVQLHFAESSRQELVEAIDEFRNMGLVNTKYVNERYCPHISLAVFREIDEEFADDLVRTVASCFAPFPIQFTHLVSFDAEVAAICYGMETGPVLAEMHQQVHDLLAGRPGECWEYYLPGVWTPHCGILVDDDRERVAKGKALLQGRDLPEVTVERLRITGFKVPHVYQLGVVDG